MSDESNHTPATSMGLLWLYAAALFLSALILFAVQPMVTKMILPILGGAAAVWNTAVTFFQAMLLLGYLYAHLLARWLSLKTQVVIHLALLALGFVSLPVHLALPWDSANNANPIGGLILLLTVSVGLPLLAVSATAPLLQKWFSHSGHKQAKDPYFLYAASNVGGMLALLAYPSVVEPMLDLSRQSRWWTVGYVLLALTVAGCGLQLWRTRSPRGAANERQPVVNDPLTWRRRGHWLALAFIPSALLLGVTLHISTDVAAVPFLWVAPLALFLLTFILTFARKPPLKHEWMLKAQVWVYVFLAVYFTAGDLVLILGLHLLGLFVTAMVCHGELVRRRPAAAHLTEFYLWISVGGLLGGVFSSILAPLLFDAILEYPLVICLACLLRPRSTVDPKGRRVFDWLLPILLELCYYLPPWDAILTRLGTWASLLFFAVVISILLGCRGRPLRLALGLAVLMLGGFLTDSSHVLWSDRSFFGLYRVHRHMSDEIHELYHGTTLHGAQVMRPGFESFPTSYYHRAGPFGQVFQERNREGRLRQIGVVGMGIGTLACYQQPGQTLTFFEIDPVVADIARDPNFFRYLSQTGEGVTVVIGDGRQSLQNIPDGHFDLLVLDAFSSDAIPVHLLTREALALYLDKLAPGGVALFHISNRYIRLGPVLANLAADAGLHALTQSYVPNATDAKLGARSAVAVVIARAGEDLAGLEANPRGHWRDLPSDANEGLWTDGYSNVFEALIWGKLLWKR